jgi:rSAM/selenodomain-associated transferase 1
MARVPGAAPVKSRLHGVLSPQEATELYRCFLLDRLDALAAVPAVERVIAFTPSGARAALAALAPPGFRLLAQDGGDLGERLTRLFAGLLGEGHGAAIAVDSDSPTLPVGYLAQGVAALDAADVVIGPTDDGGYYLIGIGAGCRALVAGPRCSALFEGVPWSTPRTRAATLERARALELSVSLLPPWFDVDTPADLDRLRADLRAHPGPARTAAFLATLPT